MASLPIIRKTCFFVPILASNKSVFILILSLSAKISGIEKRQNEVLSREGSLSSGRSQARLDIYSALKVIKSSICLFP